MRSSAADTRRHGRGWMASLVLVMALTASVILAAVGGARTAWADDAPTTPAPSAPDGPTTVTVGMFVTQLLDFDMSKRSFAATFWLWFLHDRESYDPHGTVEVTNAKSDTVRFNSLDTSKGPRWYQEKHSALLSENWDIQSFPFDRQKLAIVIEDGQFDANQIRFAADKRNSRVDPSLKVPGWTIEAFEIDSGDVAYDTSYGDPSLDADSTYSRVVATITVKRDGIRLLCSLFVGFGVAFLLASLTFFLDFDSMAGSRIGLCAAAVFAAVGNKYAIDNYLPPASRFTLTDVIVTSTFLSILLAALAVVVMQASAKTRPALARHFNWMLGVVTVAGFLAVNGYAIAQAAG